MSTSIARIGILSPVTEAGMRDWWNKLKAGLEEFGYIEGRNIEFVWRFGDGKFERLPELATELAKLGVDVIMPATPPAIYAAKSASNSIPIVFPLFGSGRDGSRLQPGTPWRECHRHGNHVSAPKPTATGPCT